MKRRVQLQFRFDISESETPCTSSDPQCGNRESSTVPCGQPQVDGTGGEGSTPKSTMHVVEQSDESIVPAKRANRIGGAAPVEAESVEGRGSAKGNEESPQTVRPQRRKHRSWGLLGVRLAAEKDRKLRFTNLMHHLTLELLTSSYFDLKKNAAAGIDEVTWREYAQDFEAHLQDLHMRVRSDRYHALASRRKWIPKTDGKLRPLGIAALEDKIVQAAVVTLLSQIYEVDFKGFSYGFRPGRSQHNALDALSVGLTQRHVNWVLDADIKGFFDNIPHEKLLQALGVRIGDRRLLKLIEQWLTAGVIDAGEWLPGVLGTPQGSVISPLLANVFLHYVLDCWVETWRQSCRGDVIIVRYADDFVMGFQADREARRCKQELQARLATFGLTLHPEKTRLIEFGRYAEQQRRQRGETRPETFNFLGFTHYCGRTRQGWFKVGRQPIATRLRATLAKLKEELRKRRHDPISQTGAWLRSVVRGWLNYFAVPGTSRVLDQFVTQVERLWLKQLRRRSQRGRRLTWTSYAKLSHRWIPRARIVHPYPDQRLRDTTCGKSRMK